MMFLDLNVNDGMTVCQRSLSATKYVFKQLERELNIHMGISNGTLLALYNSLRKSNFLFPGDTKCYITYKYISYLDLATDKFSWKFTTFCHCVTEDTIGHI